MIDKALDFFCKELNVYAQVSIPGMSADNSFCKLDSIADPDSDGVTANISKPVFISLLNIEEDRIAKSQEAYFRQDDKIVKGNPKIPLNLYCLFAVKKPTLDYVDAVRYLSHIIKFFQYKNVFTPGEFESLDPGIEKLIVDIHNVTFDQQNQIWALNGGKYYPSVIYKVRMVEIFTMPTETTGIVTSINIAEN